MRITDVIMDFDGTCTVIPEIYERFLQQYFLELNKAVFANAPLTKAEWESALQQVRQHSPTAGWTIATTPAAPAAADPYILAGEAGKLILRNRKMKVEIPGSVFGNAAEPNPAPWRPETKMVFETLLQNGINITFTSNTSSATIEARLRSLFGTVPSGLTVKSGAEKFKITELNLDSMLPKEVKATFDALPVATDQNIGRPVYIRRGVYFEAICNAFHNDLSRLKTSVFCGDIWEMDLALPYHLGANIHLEEREEPFPTYAYELDAVKAAGPRGKISKDLLGLLDWIK